MFDCAAMRENVQTAFPGYSKVNDGELMVHIGPFNSLYTDIAKEVEDRLSLLAHTVTLLLTGLHEDAGNNTIYHLPPEKFEKILGASFCRER